MAKQVINISTPNDGAGDTLYVGGGKINANFTELYNVKPTTIGTGGDYLTAGAAIAAGKSGLFVLVSNVIENGNTSAITGNEAPIYIYSAGNYTWNLSTFAFAYASEKHIFCDVVNPNFTHISVGSKTFINGTNVILSFTIIYYVFVEKCSITLPNASVLIYYGKINASLITGGGASCNLAMMTSGSTYGAITDCNFSGTINSIGCNFMRGSYGSITFYLGISVTVGASASHTDNALPGVTVDADDISGQIANASISGCVYSKIGAGTAGNNWRYNVANTILTTAHTTRRRIHYTNCHFQDNLTIGFDDNTLTACKVGNPGGATKKITISAGINDTVIRDLRTEAATVDGGTGSVITEKIW